MDQRRTTDFSEEEVVMARKTFTFLINSTGARVELEDNLVRFLLSLTIMNFEKMPHPAVTCAALIITSPYRRCTHVAPRPELGRALLALRKLYKLPVARKKALLENKAELLKQLKIIAKVFHCNHEHREKHKVVANTAKVNFLSPVRAMFGQTIASGANERLGVIRNGEIATPASTAQQQRAVGHRAMVSTSSESGQSSVADSEEEYEEEEEEESDEEGSDVEEGFEEQDASTNSDDSSDESYAESSDGCDIESTDESSTMVDEDHSPTGSNYHTAAEHANGASTVTLSKREESEKEELAATSSKADRKEETLEELQQRQWELCQKLKADEIAKEKLERSIRKTKAEMYAVESRIAKRAF